jgi:hypothetical protein
LELQYEQKPFDGRKAEKVQATPTAVCCPSPAVTAPAPAPALLLPIFRRPVQDGDTARRQDSTHDSSGWMKACSLCLSNISFSTSRAVSLPCDDHQRWTHPPRCGSRTRLRDKDGMAAHTHIFYPQDRGDAGHFPVDSCRVARGAPPMCISGLLESTRRFRGPTRPCLRPR